MALPREERIGVGNASLYVRHIGQGRPMLVLHGGPDFDHRYLVPELDRLCDAFRLVYYDQRGRGRSADGVQPEDVTLASDVADVEAVREHAFGAQSVALLAHSWGCLLALEHALAYPARVSHLVLMNPGPVSRDDYALMAADLRERWPAERRELQAIAAGAAYQAGDPDAVTAYYRIHFKPALQRPQHLEQLIGKLRASFTREGILKARAIEDRLMGETRNAVVYDLLPQLARLTMPALVMRGDHEFIPEACAAHIAAALPHARFVTLGACGHFAYLETPGALRNAIDTFFRDASHPA